MFVKMTPIWSLIITIIARILNTFLFRLNMSLKSPMPIIVVWWCGCEKNLLDYLFPEMNMILRVNIFSPFCIWSIFSPSALSISVFLLLLFLSLGLGSVGFYLQQPCSVHPQIMLSHSTRFQIMINESAGLYAIWSDIKSQNNKVAINKITWSWFI